MYVGENQTLSMVVNNDNDNPGSGENGATFTPSVSDEGVLSWTNDKGLENPAPVNINGADGKTPYIKDGNWWIGDTNTGVKAEGKDGVGISKIEKTATNEKIDTYTITYTNGNTFSYTVTNGTDGTNGRGISSIVKTTTNGRVDTYTITYTDKTTSTFTVTNGANGTSVTIASIGDVIDETTEEVIGHTVLFSDGKTITIMNGSNGKDGVPATHSWNGTTLTITSASGTSSVDLKGDTGATGQRGKGLLSVTTAPSSYTTAVGGITPKYRMDISTIKSQANVAEVLLGDTVRYSYYQYPIDYLDASYAYFTTRISVRGTSGTSVTVSSVIESTESGGSNVVTFSDNKTVTIKNGKDYVLTEADKEEIAAIATNDTHTIPDYWLSALEEGAKEINTALCTAGRNKSAFLFYTDAHWGYGSGMSPKLLKYLGKHTGINKTIFGGDFGNTYEYPDTGKTMDDWADVMREWKLAIRDIPNHHSVVGNHDKDVTAFNSDKSLYGFLFAPEESNDIVRGGDFFYYIDDKNEKTRYFYLNTGLCDFSDEQCAFLIEGLTSVPSGWHIVAVSHIWFVYDSTDTPTVGSVPTNIQKVLDLFDAYNGRTIGSVTIDRETVSYNFSACEGYVEFCIGGHTHVDYSFVTTGGIPVIICCTDSRHLRGSGYSFTFGTTTEAAVSGIIADYDAKKISVIRVGRGTSYEVPINRKEPVKYTNVLATATDADGNIYNGVGWQADREISSSSYAERDSSSGFDLTGYIKVHFGDIIRLKNITMPDATDRSNMIYFYKADKSWSGNSSINPSKTQAEPVFENGNLVQFKWYLNYNEVGGGYIRINAAKIDETSIITINEPIE